VGRATHADQRHQHDDAEHGNEQEGGEVHREVRGQLGRPEGDRLAVEQPDDEPHPERGEQQPQATQPSQATSLAADGHVERLAP
jgi:hypothetical protein